DQPGQRPSHPLLTYSRTLSYWAVAYQTPEGLFANVLDGNGRPTSSDTYKLTDTPPQIPDVGLFPSLRDPTSLFTVYSYEEHPDQSPNRVLVAHDIRTCARPSLIDMLPAAPQSSGRE